MKLYYGLPAAVIGVAIALQPKVTVAISSAEVGKIAKQITVLINSKDSSGSGIIIKSSANTYTVLTCKHVLAKAGNYTITTPDGDRYPLNYSKVKKLNPGVDLALVQFSSNKTYTVAKTGNSEAATEGTPVYVAGWSQQTAVITRSIYNFTEGKITANASQPLQDGYALVYSNDTLPGMSGGPVLNENGFVIGVHGRSDDTENAKVSNINPNIAVKTGFNLGIPIKTFLKLSAAKGTDVESRPPQQTTAITPLKADNFYIQGADKYKKGDYSGAIADLNQALRLNPKYAEAYTKRGNARSALLDYQGAIADFTQAIRLDPKLYDAYAGRSYARIQQGDKQGAHEDSIQMSNIFAQETQQLELLAKQIAAESDRRQPQGCGYLCLQRSVRENP